jgi:hypothetical protein
VLLDLALSVSQLAEACLAAGADGVYYSCWSQDVLSDTEYRELGVLTTLAGLWGAAAAEFPLLHVREALNEWVERYASNPVRVVGRSGAEGSISLSTGALSFPGKFVPGETPIGGRRAPRGGMSSSPSPLLLDTTWRETPMVECQMPAIRGSEPCPASVGWRPERPGGHRKVSGIP